MKCCKREVYCEIVVKVILVCKLFIIYVFFWCLKYLRVKIFNIFDKVYIINY